MTVLPSGIVGPNCFDHLTETMTPLEKVVQNQMPVDLDFNVNYVHVMDVAAGIIAAAAKGRNGERYLLATEPSFPFVKVFEIAHSLYPEVKVPQKMTKGRALLLAGFLEFIGKLSRSNPGLTKAVIQLNYQADARYDISKARQELGYNPRSPEEAIRETLIYLKERA